MWRMKISILSPGYQVDILEIAICFKEDRIAYDEWSICIVWINRNFNENKQAIFRSDFYIFKLLSRNAVYIQSIVRGHSACQSYWWNFDCLIFPVINGEDFCLTSNLSENCIKNDCVLRKFQFCISIGAEFFLFAGIHSNYEKKCRK